MSMKITLQDSTLWVGIMDGPPHSHSSHLGSAQCAMPPWASRKAVLALIEAAMIEAEENLKKQLETSP